MHPTPPKGDGTPARPTTTTGAGPAPRTPPPVVVPEVPEHLFDVFGPGQVASAVWDNLDGGILQHLMTRDGLLPELIASIKERYLAKTGQAESDAEAAKLHGPAVDEIVGLLVEERSALAALRALVGQDDLDIPLPQAVAVMRFVHAYPEFWPRVMSRIRALNFESRAADGRGGGLFDREQIYISKMPGTPPGAYVRLLVHETGHATFERLLLPTGQGMPPELATLSKPDLLAVLPTGQIQVTARAEQRSRSFWDAMSATAKRYYAAWLTLRQNGGKHLLGLDLWMDPKKNRLDPDQRHRYQAGDFGEFCAETFMQYAMGDLEPHVIAIQAGPAVPDEVKAAWANAWAVLDEVARPVLGKRVP
jgi:hypothetical protein